MKRNIIYNLYLAGLLLFIPGYANAEGNKWYLVTDTEQIVEMSRVCSLVAIDTEDTFSILDSLGNILAKGVLKATFTQLDPSRIKEITVKSNMLEGYVDNVLTLIGVEGDIDIFSVNGSKILNVKATRGETRINVSHFSSGVYLVKCGKQSFKFNKK